MRQKVLRNFRRQGKLGSVPEQEQEQGLPRNAKNDSASDS
jgi:hypothetical protein